MIFAMILAGVLGGMMPGAWLARNNLHPSKHLGESVLCESDKASVRGESVTLKKCWKIEVEPMAAEISPTLSADPEASQIGATPSLQ